MSIPNILTYDIETRPANAVAFNVWQVNLSQEHLRSNVEIISAAWKWLGKPKVHIYDVKTEGKTKLLTELHDALSQADAVVTYNGKKFDRRHVNRELALAGLGPYLPPAQIDLMLHVKDNFDFPFYRLDYVAERILGERKLETGGLGLWKAYIDGDLKAISLMRRYNKADVALTERLYLRLRPWIRNHPNVAALPPGLVFKSPTHECGTCGHDELVDVYRPRRTKHYAIQQLLCTNCHTFSDGARKKL